MSLKFEQDFVPRRFASFLWLDPEEVILQCYGLVEMLPDSIWPLYFRGRSCCSTSREKEGIDALDRVIELDPCFPYAYIFRGHCHVSRQNLRLGWEDFRKALDLDPQNLDAMCGRARVFRYQGDYESSMAECDRALAILPIHAHSVVNRVKVHALRGDFDDGIREADELIAQYPTWSEGYRLRGWIFETLLDFHKALADYTKAITYFYYESSQLGWIYKRRQRCARKLGLGELSDDDHLRAIRLGLDHTICPALAGVPTL